MAAGRTELENESRRGATNPGRTDGGGVENRPADQMAFGQA